MDFTPAGELTVRLTKADLYSLLLEYCPPEQLMKEAERLTNLTSPRAARMAELGRIQDEIARLPDGPERNAKLAERENLVSEMRRLETEQTDTMSDAQIVEMVEKAIRDNPKDFPLLTKYYLNAE